MEVRQRRRTTDAAGDIKAAVGGLFACGHFVPSRFPLPSEKGAQLSMTGEIVAFGNGGSLDFSHETLLGALRTYPAMYKTPVKDLERWIERGRYTVLCGDCDRSAAIIGSVTELVRCGVNKIIIATDTKGERGELLQSLDRMRAGLGGITVTAYRLTGYDESTQYKASSLIYAYLTSDKPEILVIGRDSFSRSTNLLRRGTEGYSLADLLGEAHPMVIASTRTVESGRTLSKIASVFQPAATLIFAGEVRRLRDAVLYKPENGRSRKDRRVIPEQMAME